MSEYIGKVFFDDNYGLDSEKNGSEEMEKLDHILSDFSETEYNKVIAQEKNWAILYALTHIRENLVSWLPVRKTDRVLEIGGGTGELTGALAERAGSVTVLEKDKTKARLCAKRHQKYENLSVYAGGLSLLEEVIQGEFDWIFLADAFEDAGNWIDGLNPHEQLLRLAGNRLSDCGHVVAGTANRLGLKYFAGNKEENKGTYFSGIEGYDDTEKARSFSRPEFLKLAEKCGYEQQKLYYPYPDLHYPMSIYSDEYLPKVGELWDNRRNFKEERYVLFDETKAFDNVIKDGLFPVFSNAFLLLLAKKKTEPEARTVIFSKYSNERGRAFAIRTDICELPDRTRLARKSACFPEGKDHVKHLLRWQERLGKVYENTPIRLNRCWDADDYVEMEYLTGSTLEEELDRLLLDGKRNEALQKFLAYVAIVREAGSVKVFEKTPEFEKIFGEVLLPVGLRCSEVTDIDMVAGNVIVSGDCWIHMDYEWTFDFPIPVNYVIYRIIQNFIHGNVKRTVMEKAWLYKQCGLTDLEIEQYTKMEEAFQKYITQQNVPLRKLYEEISPGCISFAEQEEQRKLVAEQNQQLNTGIEIFVDSFEIAMTGIYVYGWAVSKAERKVEFSLRDEQGNDLEVVQTEYLYRKDVADNFNLSGKNRFAGFRLQCKLPDQKATTNKVFTLIARDGRCEVPFQIPVGKLRLKQSKIGKKLMDLRGAKDVIQYIAPKEMGFFTESEQYRVENQRFDTWQMANRLSKKEIAHQQNVVFQREPMFTVMILSDAETKDTRRTVESLNKQTYGKFDIHFGGYDTVDFEKIAGDYVIFMEPGDTLKASALYEMTVCINQDESVQMIYTDSDKVDWKRKEYFDPQFKPDYSAITLKSGNYIGNSICFSRELLQKIGKVEAGYGTQAIYDLILKGADLTDKIEHISKLLYHQANPMERDFDERNELEKIWEQGKLVLKDYYERKGKAVEVYWADYPLRYQVKWKMEGTPLISIIIPTQDHTEDLELCLSSITEKSTYQNYEILVIENNSRQKATFDYYRRMTEKYPKVRLLRWESVFNYSAINNYAAREAKGEYFVFLNNDTEVLTPDWMEEMVSVCQQEKVGVVGTRLYYPDGTLQHAGVILGLGSIAGHLFVKEPGRISGYMGRACIRQNLSAVTAACMMSSREAFECVQGFDERLQVALNDVDFCLKCVKSGYQVVYDPDTELYHYESKSRGLDTTPEKKARYDGEVAYFKERWGELLEKGDPFYNVNLSRTTWNCTLRIPRKD